MSNVNLAVPHQCQQKNLKQACWFCWLLGWGFWCLWTITWQVRAQIKCKDAQGVGVPVENIPLGPSGLYLEKKLTLYFPKHPNQPADAGTGETSATCFWSPGHWLSTSIPPNGSTNGPTLKYLLGYVWNKIQSCQGLHPWIISQCQDPCDFIFGKKKLTLYFPKHPNQPADAGTGETSATCFWSPGHWLSTSIPPNGSTNGPTLKYLLGYVWNKIQSCQGLHPWILSQCQDPCDFIFGKKKLTLYFPKHPNQPADAGTGETSATCFWSPGHWLSTSIPPNGSTNGPTLKYLLGYVWNKIQSCQGLHPWILSQCQDPCDFICGKKTDIIFSKASKPACWCWQWRNFSHLFLVTWPLIAHFNPSQWFNEWSNYICWGMFEIKSKVAKVCIPELYPNVRTPVILYLEKKLTLYFPKHPNQPADAGTGETSATCFLPPGHWLSTSIPPNGVQRMVQPWNICWGMFEIKSKVAKVCIPELYPNVRTPVILYVEKKTNIIFSKASKPACWCWHWRNFSQCG